MATQLSGLPEADDVPTVVNQALVDGKLGVEEVRSGRSGRSAEWGLYI